MDTTKTPASPRRTRRWPWLVLIVGVVVLGGIRWAMQADRVMDRIAVEIERIGSQQLNGTVEIELLRGDLLREITLTGLSVRDDEGMEVIAVDTLYMRYRLASLFRRGEGGFFSAPFFQGPFEINEISVIAPRVEAVQSADMEWNLLRLLPESEAEPASEGGMGIDIQQVRLARGSLRVVAPELLPDDEISVDSLHLHASLFAAGEVFRARLSALDLRVVEGRLPEPIAIQLAARAEDDRITLDQLTVATGRSLLQATGRVAGGGEEIAVQAGLQPLSWRDVMAYTGEALVLQDVQVGLEVSGGLQELRLTLELDALGLERGRLFVEAGVQESIELYAAEVKVQRLDLPLLTGNEEWPSLGEVFLSTRGIIAPDAPEQAVAHGEFHLTRLMASPYRLDRLEGSYVLDRGRARAEIAAMLDDERIDLELRASELFDPAPDWSAEVTSSGLTLGRWAADPDLDVFTRFRFQASGQGTDPNTQPWKLDATLSDLMVSGQPLQRIQLDAELTRDDLLLYTTIRIIDSELNLNAALTNWQQPEALSYRFLLESEGLNLRDVNGFEDFPTSITLRALGSGSGTDPETLTLESSLEIDDSIINGADIERFQANLRLTNGLLTLDNTFLQSSLATGQLDVRLLIANLYSEENRVDFNLEVGQLHPLAPLAGLETLQASGRIGGSLTTGSDGTPSVETVLHLRDVIIDQGQVSRLEGRAGIRLTEEPSYSLDVRLAEATAGEFTLATMQLVTRGNVRGDRIDGTYRVQVDFTDDTRFRTQATYTVDTAEDLPVVELVTNVLDLQDPSYRYFLKQPFTLTYQNALVTLDPLILTGEEGVELTVTFEQYLEQAFRARFDARDVNLGILQRILLDDTLFDGMMNGSISADIDLASDLYDMDARFVLSAFEMDGFTLDVVEADLRLLDGRLNGHFNVSSAGDTLLRARVNLPFLPGDPVGFDESFFREEVFAEIRTSRIVLQDNPALARLLGLEEVSGTVSLDGTASGTAGAPEMQVGLRMTGARISGVTLDTLTFNAAYLYEQARFTVDSRVISAGQPAARLQGYIPLGIDMRTFDITLPDKENPVAIALETRDFNIAAFNQFTDPALLRNLAGRINADLEIGGTLDEPELEGRLQLSSGSLFLTENNVTIRDIETVLRFTPDAIELRQLNMTSLGSLSGSGRIHLDGFIPGEVDLTLQARNFRAFNTRDIQVIFSMDAALSGGIDTPSLTGSLQLERGYLYLDNFGERTVEEVTLEGEEPSLFDGMEFFNNLAMEVNFRTDRNFWVRNRARPEVQLQLTGELDIVKYAGEDVQVFGAMGATDGYVTQLGRRFELEEAEVMFSGPATNPALNVRTLYELRQPSDIRIWYIIGGTADEPTFSYESDPQMETGDIISYTLFGRPLNALAGWQQSVAGRSDGGVGDAAVDILLDRVEQLASQALGIDVLSIDNTRTGGQSGTTIKAGKFISDRIFVALIQELGTTVSSQVMLEYQIRRNLDLIVTGGDNNRNGLEIQWRRDY